MTIEARKTHKSIINLCMKAIEHVELTTKFETKSLILVDDTRDKCANYCKLNVTGF